MNEFIHDIMDKKGILILAGIFLFLFMMESVFQLRRRVQFKWKRIFINSVVSIPAFTALRLLFLPAVVWIAFRNQSWQLGLNFIYDFPYWIEFCIGFLLLDYSNYVWHILLHKVPLLWRFHLVHHCDPDLDLTTALRFHAGELFASIVFRGIAVFLIGASPLLVLVYEIAFEAATQFHHSNWRLPFQFERLLNKAVVTPRMHGIHHSIIKDETDKNYSIIFSWWDRMHQTIKLNIHQRDIVIGVPSYHADELTIGFLWKLPFTKIRPWGNDAAERNKDAPEKLRE